GGKHAGGQRAMGEVEVRFARRLLTAERKLEPARLDIERLRHAQVDIGILPRGLFTEIVRRFEVVAQFARDLERDAFERGPFDTDSAILPVDLPVVEAQRRRGRPHLAFDPGFEIELDPGDRTPRRMLRRLDLLRGRVVAGVLLLGFLPGLPFRLLCRLLFSFVLRWLLTISGRLRPDLPIVAGLAAGLLDRESGG